jgi:protein-S-isoprenylcysteine O-methyltransferase Ste14
MSISQLVFRLRVVLLVIIYTVGFYAPWSQAFGWTDNFPAMAWLSDKLAHATGIGFQQATTIIVVLTILSALKGMVWRVWGTAYLGTATVYSGAMQGAQLQANGPYRFVRNPLYIGSLSTMVAVSTLMPPSGAVFVIVMVTLVYIVLIDGEERFLGAKLGQPYLDYCRAVPRIIPRMWRPLAASGAKADWLMGAVGEVNTIGIFLAFAILSWRFDRMLMVRAVLVCFGLSLVVRALLPRKAEAERQS